MLYQCAVDGVPHHPCVSNKQDKTDVGLLLAHRLRRWPINIPTLVHCLIFLVTAPPPRVHLARVQTDHRVRCAVSPPPHYRTITRWSDSRQTDVIMTAVQTG